MSVLVEEVNRR